MCARVRARAHAHAHAHTCRRCRGVVCRILVHSLTHICCCFAFHHDVLRRPASVTVPQSHPQQSTAEDQGDSSKGGQLDHIQDHIWREEEGQEEGQEGALARPDQGAESGHGADAAAAVAVAVAGAVDSASVAGLDTGVDAGSNAKAKPPVSVSSAAPRDS